MITYRLKFFTIFTFLFSSTIAFSKAYYPQGPNPQLTPGSRCEDADYRRHPEKIKYCKRDVSGGEKWEVIGDYNDLGYRITKRNRYQFKMDHLVPLCIGGSNEKDNLWPQHETIYVRTDNIEHFTCELVSEGRMTQDRAIELVLRAKQNLEEASEIEAELRRLTGRD